MQVALFNGRVGEEARLLARYQSLRETQRKLHAALLKQLYPQLSVEQLKALAMNTALNDLRSSTAITANIVPSSVTQYVLACGTPDSSGITVIT